MTVTARQILMPRRVDADRNIRTLTPGWFGGGNCTLKRARPLSRITARLSSLTVEYRP
jgi:hypothetical protein